MTLIDFYNQLHDIITKFSYNMNKEYAMARINLLNEKAKEANLDVEVNSEILDNIDIENFDDIEEMEYDDYDEGDDYYDDYGDDYDYDYDYYDE